MSRHQRDCHPGPAAADWISALLPAGQFLAGALLLLRPDPVRRALGSASSCPPPAWTVRLLGTRLTAQAITTTVRRDPAVLLASAGVEATHAASMLLLAALLPRYRRAGLISAAAATGSTALTLIPLTRNRPRRPSTTGRPNA